MNTRLRGVIRKENKNLKKKTEKKTTPKYRNFNKTKKIWKPENRLISIIYCNIGIKPALKYMQNNLKWKNYLRCKINCSCCEKVLAHFRYQNIDKFSYFEHFLIYHHNNFQNTFNFEEKVQDTSILKPYKSKPRKEKFYLEDAQMELFKQYAKFEF